MSAARISAIMQVWYVILLAVVQQRCASIRRMGWLLDCALHVRRARIVVGCTVVRSGWMDAVAPELRLVAVGDGQMLVILGRGRRHMRLSQARRDGGHVLLLAWRRDGGPG